MGLLVSHSNTRIRRATAIILLLVVVSLLYRAFSPNSALPLPLVLPDYSTTHGHLYYTPQHPLHPIHQLIETNKLRWRNKLQSQSKSLHEAVDEYERRYNMRPPRGFADWYWFAKGHGSALIDEYDSIHNRIRPFHALPSALLRLRSEQLQFTKDFWMANNAFTIAIAHAGERITKHGPMAGQPGDMGRADQLLLLLNGIGKWLPALNITVSGHDSPWVVLSGELKDRHAQAVTDNKILTEEESYDAMDNYALDGFTTICPPTSPIRSPEMGGFDGRADGWTPKQPSFIDEHVDAMDLCQHPENQPIHGFTAWSGPRPALLYPLFTMTTTTFHSDLLLPPTEQYDSPVGPDPEWEDKAEEKLLWRGTTTGADLTNEHHRVWSQRVRLCKLHKQPGVLSVPLALSDSDPSAPTPSYGPLTQTASLAKTLAAHYLDFKFLYPAQQCGDVASCKALHSSGMFEWDGWMEPREANRRKYILDVDGNGWSGRFHRLMSSNSLVLKSTIFPEWYTERIQPWVHYVPVSVDYTDLLPIMAFFRGDTKGNGAHDHLAKEIADAGKMWTEDMWHWSDMQVYMFRLLLEYARIMNRDPKNPTNMDM